VSRDSTRRDRDSTHGLPHDSQPTSGTRTPGEEARQAALEDLVPAAIKSLQAHLGDGDPAAWRAALRVFEHAFGRAPEQVIDGFSLPESSDEVGRLSWVQMQILASRLLADVPTKTAVTTEPTITTGGSAATTASR